jgi:hypothetical protein
MVRSKSLLPPLAKQRSSSTASSSKIAIANHNNNATDKRGVWPQRLQFWRSNSNNSIVDREGRTAEGDEEEEEDDASYGGSGSLITRSDGAEEDERSTSSASSTSTESYGHSYVTGDGEYEDDTYITNGDDEERTQGTFEDEDEEGEEKSALQDFVGGVGGVLSNANRSFRSFIASSTSIIESTNTTAAIINEDEDDTTATAIEYDEATYDQNESSIIHQSPSCLSDQSSSKITTTTAEENLSSSVKLVHEIHEVQGGGSEDDSTVKHRDKSDDVATSAIFGSALYSMGCVPFDPLRILRRHTSKTSTNSGTNNMRANRSFASEAEESNFLQMQEKLRETQREKLIRITQSLEDTDTTATPGFHDENGTEQIYLMRDVLDNLPFFGCVPSRPFDECIDDNDHQDHQLAEEDATYAYDTGTEYDKEEAEEEKSSANETDTYGDDCDTNGYETQYKADEDNYESKRGYDSTNQNNSNKKYSIRKSLRLGLQGLRYGDLNRLYQSTDESSVGSGMDQSHIYLMMTSARRQRTMQQRQQQHSQQHSQQRSQQHSQQHSQQYSQQHGQQHGQQQERQFATAKIGVEPHHARWMSMARPQIMSTVAPQQQAIEYEARNSFLGARFVNDFFQGTTNTNTAGSTDSPHTARQLEMQATKEIQDRWIREIQMALVTSDKYAPDQERLQAAQEALERIRENGRGQPQKHHFRLSTSNSLRGAGI